MWHKMGSLQSLMRTGQCQRPCAAAPANCMKALRRPPANPIHASGASVAAPGHHACLQGLPALAVAAAAAVALPPELGQVPRHLQAEEFAAPQHIHLPAPRPKANAAARPHWQGDAHIADAAPGLLGRLRCCLRAPIAPAGCSGCCCSRRRVHRPGRASGCLHALAGAAGQPQPRVLHSPVVQQRRWRRLQGLDRMLLLLRHPMLLRLPRCTLQQPALLLLLLVTGRCSLRAWRAVCWRGGLVGRARAQRILWRAAGGCLRASRRWWGDLHRVHVRTILAAALGSLPASPVAQTARRALPAGRRGPVSAAIVERVHSYRPQSPSRQNRTSCRLLTHLHRHSCAGALGGPQPQPPAAAQVGQQLLQLAGGAGGQELVQEHVVP